MIYKIIYTSGGMSQETDVNIHVVRKDFKTKESAQKHINKMSKYSEPFIVTKENLDKTKDLSDLL